MKPSQIRPLLHSEYERLLNPDRQLSKERRRYVRKTIRDIFFVKLRVTSHIDSGYPPHEFRLSANEERNAMMRTWLPSYKAYRAGVEAKSKGVSRDSNPYKITVSVASSIQTAAENAWECGYLGMDF